MLKPENIMVRADDSVTLIAFGLASLVSIMMMLLYAASRQ